VKKAPHIVIILIVLALIGAGVVTWWLDHSDKACREERTIRIVRYDCLVEDYVETGNVALWQRMNNEFPLETRTLIEDVLHLGHSDAEGIEDSLCAFYRDSVLTLLRRDVNSRFADMSDVECQLGKAFRQMQEEVPNFKVPRVYTQFSALSESIIVGDSLIGISLDKYLGADYPLYKKYFNPNQRATMQPERIVQDCLFFYLNQLYAGQLARGDKHYTMLDLMLHLGKLNWVVAYVTQQSLVDVAAFQPATRQWYEQHERSVWEKLQKSHLLNVTDTVRMHTVLYSNDAHPFFSDPHSRGVGLWIGMRIIDSYMKQHPETSLDELLNLTDYQRILRESKY